MHQQDTHQEALSSAISSLEMLGVAMEAAGVDPELLVLAGDTAALLKDIGRGSSNAVAAKAAQLRSKVDSIRDAGQETRRVARQIRDGSYKSEEGNADWRRSWQARLAALSKPGREMAYRGLARELDAAGLREMPGQDTLIAVSRLYRRDQVQAEAVMSRAVAGVV